MTVSSIFLIFICIAVEELMHIDRLNFCICLFPLILQRKILSSVDYCVFSLTSGNIYHYIL